MATLTREAEETAGYALNRLIDSAIEVRSAVDGGDDVDDMREALDEITGGLADLFDALGIAERQGKHGAGALTLTAAESAQVVRLDAGAEVNGNLDRLADAIKGLRR